VAHQLPEVSCHRTRGSCTVLHHMYDSCWRTLQPGRRQRCLWGMPCSVALPPLVQGEPARVRIAALRLSPLLLPAGACLLPAGLSRALCCMTWCWSSPSSRRLMV
jgi:hypothetical protein